MKKPQEAQKAKAVRKMKAAKNAGEEYYDPTREEGIKRRNETRLALWEEHLKNPIVLAERCCRPARNLFTLFLSWRKYSHIPRTYGSFPIILQILPRYAFFSTTCLHCTFVSGFSPFAFRELLKHFWHKLVVHDSSPSLSTTDANCQ